MAGSTGVGFTPQEVLEVMPPHLLIYFYERIKPNKHVVFDLGEGLAPLWNEAGGLSGIPFEHLVVTAQSAFSFEEMLDGLSRTGYKTQATRHKEKIKQEIGYIQNWLKKYAPARYKFAVQKKLPKIRLSAIQKEFLSNILTAFTNIEWTGEKLHQEIHRIKNHLKISPREAFSSIYQIFLNKDSGPKVGWFLASLSKDFVIKRLKEATK
jgi:lysyl-tRNA synthetase class 1